MKVIFILIAICTFPTVLFSQTSYKSNDVYLEVGGNGLFSSVNYERHLLKKPGLGVRIGLGFYTEDNFYVTLPIGMNYLFKMKGNSSFIEGGIGVTWARVNGKLFISDKNSDGFNFTNVIPSIGYRKHTKKDLMWRINLTPIINNKNVAFLPWLGVSVGKRF